MVGATVATGADVGTGVLVGAAVAVGCRVGVGAGVGEGAGTVAVAVGSEVGVGVAGVVAPGVSVGGGVGVLVGVGADSAPQAIATSAAIIRAARSNLLIYFNQLQSVVVNTARPLRRLAIGRGRRDGSQVFHHSHSTLHGRRVNPAVIREGSDLVESKGEGSAPRKRDAIPNAAGISVSGSPGGGGMGHTTTIHPGHLGTHLDLQVHVGNILDVGHHLSPNPPKDGLGDSP